MHSEELLEIRNHVLVHELQDRGGVEWKVEKFYKIELFEDVIFKVRRVGRCIDQDEKGLQG